MSPSIVNRPVLVVCGLAGLSVVTALVAGKHRRPAHRPSTAALLVRAGGTYSVYVIGSALDSGSGIRLWSFFSDVVQPRGEGWQIDLPRDVDYTVEVRGYRTCARGGSFQVAKFVYRADVPVLLLAGGTPGRPWAYPQRLPRHTDLRPCPTW